MNRLHFRVISAAAGRTICAASQSETPSGGNITWPLFIVLVVSYMLKDRIKELLRYYFAHKLGNKYYDKKAGVTIGKNLVGYIKEGFYTKSLIRIKTSGNLISSG